MNTNRTKPVVVGIGFGIAALGWLVFASGSETTQIYACVANSTGAVRIVSQTADCKNGETKTQWAVVGPVGPQGPIGPQGPDGPRGFDGARGLEGPPGVSVPRVLDNINREVGWPAVPYGFGRSLVVMHLNTDWVPVLLTRNQFVTDDATQFSFVHDTADCSGPRYLGQPVLQQESIFSTYGHERGQVNGTTVFYGTGPLVTRTILSIEGFPPGADVRNVASPFGGSDGNPGCYAAPVNHVLNVNAVSTFDLSTLGLLPPFQIER